jgi:hypothetical protein
MHVHVQVSSTSSVLTALGSVVYFSKKTQSNVCRRVLGISKMKKEEKEETCLSCSIVYRIVNNIDYIFNACH